MKEKLYKIISSIMIISSFSLATAGLSLTVATPVLADTVSEIKDGVIGSGGGGSKNRPGRVTDTIRVVVNILLFLIGSFAVIMIVIAGFRFVTSNGDSNTISSARNTILYAVIGLVVAFLAYALVNFVIRQLS